jgi:cytochrome c oxidase subunit II
MQLQPSSSLIRCALALASGLVAASPALAAGPAPSPSIFAPASTPAYTIYGFSLFVITITAAIFVVVAGLLVYVIYKYKERDGQPQSEPPQIYGSVQVELAWTVIPVIIVLVLFLTTTRIIFAVQNQAEPKSAINVDVIGHQFWWEFRYPKLHIVTANELHIPVSSQQQPQPTFLRLFSADVVHSFWVPQLAGKTDLIPNHPNQMWMEPNAPGLYVGQCAQFCGVEHAKMLIRVYVDTPEQFDAWVKDQQQPAAVTPAVAAGRRIFETEACMNCHTINGTAAKGTVGPDLTHLMSRSTIADGAVLNTTQNLHAWIQDPNNLKPGSLMPAMQLSDQELDQVVAYLSTLR